MPDSPLTTAFDMDLSVLRVSGDVDEESTHALREMIEECSKQYSTSLEVDLTGVTYLPSVAIGALVRVEQTFASSGTTLGLAARSGSLAHRVLTVSAMPFRSY